MNLLVVHLTRMEYPHICAAGFESITSDRNHFKAGRHIRPVKGRLTKDLLPKFQLGAVVDLGPTKHVSQPPETEDYSFEPTSLSISAHVPRQQFWEILESNAKHNLRAIFGSDLQEHGASGVVKPGGGTQSLGELRIKEKPKLYINDFGQLRIQVPDQHFPGLDLSVTDIRFYETSNGNWNLKANVAHSIEQQLRSSNVNDIILAVGLTREYKGFHWMQTNNVYFKDDPLWKGSLSNHTK